MINTEASMIGYVEVSRQPLHRHVGDFWDNAHNLLGYKKPGLWDKQSSRSTGRVELFNFLLGQAISRGKNKGSHRLALYGVLMGSQS
jgi:hypothetical protein